MSGRAGGDFRASGRGRCARDGGRRRRDRDARLRRCRGHARRRETRRHAQARSDLSGSGGAGGRTRPAGARRPARPTATRSSSISGRSPRRSSSTATWTRRPALRCRHVHVRSGGASYAPTARQASISRARRCYRRAAFTRSLALAERAARLCAAFPGRRGISRRHGRRRGARRRRGRGGPADPRGARLRRRRVRQRDGGRLADGLRGQFRWYDDASRSELAGDDRRRAVRVAARLGLRSTLGSRDRSGRPAVLDDRTALPPARPATIPVFDGGIAIDTLRVRHAGTDEMYVRFDAAIRPISVALLSRAFGWPEFQGTLEGSIPGLQLRQGVVTLDGALEARVFDGRVAVQRAHACVTRSASIRACLRTSASRTSTSSSSRAPSSSARSPAGSRATSRTSRPSTGCRRRSTRSCSRRPTTVPKAHQPARGHQPVEHRRRQRRRSRGRAAGRLAAILRRRSVTTGWDSAAGSRTTSASWAACCRRPAAVTTS